MVNEDKCIVKYNCPLSEETQRVAKEQLREDNDSRDHALQQMQEWVKRNPRIERCRTGTPLRIIMYEIKNRQNQFMLTYGRSQLNI